MDETLKAGNRCPVMHNFDHESPEYAADWQNILKSMRSETPRAWTEAYGGHWIATRYDDVLKIAQTPDVFGAAKHIDPVTGEIVGGVQMSNTGAPPLIPLESDNPEWYGYRSLLNRRFAPQVAEKQRDFAKSVARMLINNVIETGHFDIVNDLANPLPAIFTMRLLGFDMNAWAEFAYPLHKFSYTPADDPDYPAIVAKFIELGGRLLATALERRNNPRDDLLSEIANGEANGKKLTEVEILQMAMLVVIGGIDTTTALTSNALLYLADHPDERQLLIEDPSKIKVAREEFVRFFTPVHATGRQIKQDFDMDGWQVRKGEKVMLCWASANRDETVFDDPDTVHLDRLPNRHMGFGAGNHRCIGSFFARVMFESMVEEVLERMPDYVVDKTKARRYPSVGKSNGWIDIPASFTPGPKLDGGFKL